MECGQVHGDVTRILFQHTPLRHGGAGLPPGGWGPAAFFITGSAAMAWVVLVVMGGYLLARIATGRLRTDARATLDNTALMWHYVTVQGLVAMGLERGLPGWLPLG